MVAAAFSSNYYAGRKNKLLRGYDRVAKRARKSLNQYYGVKFSEEVIRETRDEYEELIPQLPYVGGSKNYAGTSIIVINGWLIAFFRVMKGKEKPVDDVVRVACEISDSYFRPIPRFILTWIGLVAFSRFFKMILKQQAAHAQKKKYPAGWVMAVEEGDGKDYDLVLITKECACHKMYKTFNAEALAPYCNFFDLTYSRYLGMGLDATKTIGLGCEACRLSYKKGRETKIPPLLKDLMPADIL